MIGLATWFVWYLDDTGASTVATYAYVDALNAESAIAQVKAWGVDLAAIRTHGEAPQHDRADARRYYIVSEFANAPEAYESLNQS